MQTDVDTRRGLTGPVLTLRFTPAEWRALLEDPTFLTDPDNSYLPRRLMGLPVQIVPDHLTALACPLPPADYQRGEKMFSMPSARKSPTATPAAMVPAVRRKPPSPLFAANGLDCTGAPA